MVRQHSRPGISRFRVRCCASPRNDGERPCIIPSLRDIPPGYDVVVIGAGAAGMSAALFAAIRGARTLLVEKIGFRRRHLGAVGGIDLDTEYPSCIRYRCVRQRRQRRAISAADRRQPGGRQFARGLPQRRPRSGRGAGKPFRRKTARLSAPSRLSLGARRRCRGGACAGAAAVRRAVAGRCASAGSAADPGIHAARRHDGRPHRHWPFAVGRKVDEIAAAHREAAGAIWP